MHNSPSRQNINPCLFVLSLCNILQSAVDIEEGEPPEEPEDGSYPRTDSTYSIDIPNSSTLWEADPRPDNSSQVTPTILHLCLVGLMNQIVEAPGGVVV